MTAVFLDVDGTLTDVSSPWQDIHEHYKLWDTRGVGIAESWLQGKISYDEFCHKDVDMWNELGLKLVDIHSRFDNYPVRQQAGPVIDLLVNAGLQVVLLSSGFRYIGYRVLEKATVGNGTLLLANDIYSLPESGKLACKVEVSGDKDSDRSKAGHVIRCCKDFNLDPSSAIAIGDGPSDQHMFDACGSSYLVKNGNDLLAAAEDIVKNFKLHTADNVSGN